jgi:hypothetical protein
MVFSLCPPFLDSGKGGAKRGSPWSENEGDVEQSDTFALESIGHKISQFL